jgi:uncharacterized membrane protein YfcA
MDLHLAGLGPIVLLAYTVQAMTGFGSVIIAVTLGSHLFPLQTLLAILVPMDVLLNAYLVGRHRAHVDREVLFVKILPLMGLGLLAGIGLFHFLKGDMLKRAFGLLVVLLSARELWRLSRGDRARSAVARWKYALTVAGAGLVQGMFASGGPLIAYAADRIQLSKARFRSTLACLWLITNTVLTVSYTATGWFGLESAKAILVLLPLVALGTLAGEKLHDRVNERSFRFVVYAILIFAGASLLLR